MLYYIYNYIHSGIGFDYYYKKIDAICASID